MSGEKVPHWPESLSYQKKDGRGMALTFPKKNLKNWCLTKRRMGATMRANPSFGMTTTQDIRDIFA